ncbi:MAG: zinc ABC transporter substrate-binding protein [FCB group bacterium]|nr:zinc ABC transporter substrate-binding protein [FCB group bacterium]
MKNITLFSLRLFLLFSIFLLISCDTAVRSEICVSIQPQAYLVNRIAGEDMKVTVMIPPGSAPPTYAPTASQIRDLHQSKLYVKIGHPDFLFEKKHIDPFLDNNPRVLKVNMSDSLDILPGDAHIWLSPTIMLIASERIYKAFLALYPENKQLYTERYEALKHDILELDTELRNMLDGARGSEFLTMHPAWTYFARDYGIKQVSVHDENKALSVQKLAALIEYAKEKDLKVIFIQKEFAFEQVDLLSREIGANIVALDPLSADWLENLRYTGQILSKAFNE